ncbi:MAG: histidine phosphatase family protein [Promethearchaeota archaeon]
MELTDLSLDIYLIRHADAPAGFPNHWSSLSTPLSQIGIKQAKNLAEQLKNHSFDAIFTSPFTRAKQTAEIIADICEQVEIQEQNWLAEIDVGEWAGRLKSGINHKISSTVKEFLRKGYKERGPLVSGLLSIDKKFSFPSGESLENFWNRVTKGFNETLNQFRGLSSKNLCFIGHGGSFSVIVLNLINKSFKDDNFPVFMFNKADLTLIRIKNRQVFFLQINPFRCPPKEVISVSNGKLD